ncbi:MAG: NADH-quinone oxidoreductase subunit A [Deltaproteobacteria bacterium]|nr:NADH-quinone oxidoreductase subunit A [Deltaproteobacteria bacterium]
METFLPIGLLMIFALVVCVGIYVLTTWLGPKKPSNVKLSTYECGVDPEGNARIPFPAKFYLIAVLFLLFDVEAVFFFPWAIIYKGSLAQGGHLFWAMLIYLAFMVLALIYVYRKDCLRMK